MIDNAKAKVERLDLKGHRLWLLPQKAIYWEKKKMLLIADPHLGKAGHFRKNGIPVPGQVNSTNLQLLNRLLQSVEAEHLVILGDLFHSHRNLEWNHFLDWRSQYPALEVTLVIGNHDILPDDLYHASRLNLFKKLRINPFLLVHDLNTPGLERNSGYLLSGHIHPAVLLKGKGRQAMKLPCFYFGTDRAILPAFGQFTGTHVIKPGPGDRVFAVAKQQVLSISGNGELL